jgi:hypothetical protein
MVRIVSFLILSFMVVTSLFAQPGGGQNNTCATAAPFCAGTQYTFPAGVNAGNGEAGPCYDCLVNIPNPAWYFMRVGSEGNFILEIQSEPARDIDFCCWGPFNTPNSCSQLTCNKVVSCDYGPGTTKTCTIPYSYVGQYYMIVVANFSNLPCNILFTQTGGTGMTDCTILPPPCSANSPLCLGQTIQLTAQSVLSGTYQWTGPNGFVSGVQNPTIPDAQLINAGDYYLHVFVNGIPDPDSSKATVNIYQPQAEAGNDTMIQNGVNITLHGSGSQGSGSYKYHWEPANLLVDPDVASPVTVNLFSAMIFTLTVTDDSASCQAEDFVTVSISGGPLAVNGIAIPSTICSGEITQLNAFGSGGTGLYSYHWTGPGNFSSNLQNPTVQPLVTTTFTVEINDGYNTITNTVTVDVIPLPVANAGEDKSIPFGTYTFLNGSVDGGTSNYFYSWEPANKLINPNVQFPQTRNLTTTTVYSLTVTDLVTNCVSGNQANVSIEVTGGALNANPVATPDWICRGDTTQLYASAGGGNVGFYEYNWISDPAGFTSQEKDPFVYPVENTIYHVTVFDGFNSAEGNTTVSLYPEPFIHLGPPDTSLCLYDTIMLDAGNPGCSYLWSNGATTKTILVQAAGIAPEIQRYDVKVSNEHGCSTSSEITINFLFSSCTGMNEGRVDPPMIIFPNPSDGKITLRTVLPTAKSVVTVLNLLGNEVYKEYLPAGPNAITEIPVDLSQLPKGIYFFRLTSPEGSRMSKIIIRYSEFLYRIYGIPICQYCQKNHCIRITCYLCHGCLLAGDPGEVYKSR